MYRSSLHGGGWSGRASSRPSGAVYGGGGRGTGEGGGGGGGGGGGRGGARCRLDPPVNGQYGPVDGSELGVVVGRYSG